MEGTFGERLADSYIRHALPGWDGPFDRVGLDPAIEIFAKHCPAFAALARDAVASGAAWAQEAVDEVDAALVSFAVSGAATFELALDGAGRIELFRRWTYSLALMQDTRTAGTPLTFGVPRVSDPLIRGAVVILIMLGDHGRSYPQPPALH